LIGQHAAKCAHHRFVRRGKFREDRDVGFLQFDLLTQRLEIRLPVVQVGPHDANGGRRTFGHEDSVRRRDIGPGGHAVDHADQAHHGRGAGQFQRQGDKRQQNAEEKIIEAKVAGELDRPVQRAEPGDNAEQGNRTGQRHDQKHDRRTQDAPDVQLPVHDPHCTPPSRCLNCLKSRPSVAAWCRSWSVARSPD
jgi:hypothetical protein